MTRHARIVKVGGAHLDDPAFLDRLHARLAELCTDSPVVLVHGGGNQIAEMQRKMAIEPHIVDGLRVTTSEAMRIVAMVLAGQLNKQLVAHFVHHGLGALGVSGADGGLLRAPFHGTGQLGRVGGVPRVDQRVLEALLTHHDVLVVAPVCLAPDGGLLNVNADTAAPALAVALHAEVLEFVTDVDHVKTPDGPLTRVSPPMVEDLIRTHVVNGGMRPKMEAAVSAVRHGVSVVRVGSLESLASGQATEVMA